MPTRPDHFHRRWFLGLWTGFDPRDDEVTCDPGASQAQYCYAVGEEYRVWVHRAEPPSRWFGVKRTTRNTLLDRRMCDRRSQNYCTDGRRLVHLLIVGSEREFHDFMRSGIERADLQQLEWYVFPDEQLDKVATDGNGTAENYHIYDDLLEDQQHYRYDRQNCLPYKDPSLAPQAGDESVAVDDSGVGIDRNTEEVSDSRQRLIQIAQNLCE